MAAIKYKILAVHAIACVVVIKYGHTKKYAKHIVALIIKQILELTDKELSEFLATNEIGRFLNKKCTLIIQYSQRCEKTRK